ncbi:MAG: hypothetical protein ACRD5D_00550 [Candidatus Polarisedimenticolia bacterium]
MGVISFMATGFFRTSGTGITDVQDILDELDDALTAQLDVEDRWTEAPAGTFTSPADLAGRQMKIVVARDSATRMLFDVKDQNGLTIRDGSIDIAATANFRIWCGPHHVYVEVDDGAGAYEVARASMLDPRPEVLNAHQRYVVGMTTRDGSGNLDGNSPLPEFWSFFDTGGVAGFGRALWLRAANANSYKTANAMELTTGIPIVMNPNTTPERFAGSLFQAVWVDADNAPGDIVDAPIADGVTGEFEVLGLDTASAAGNVRLAVRAG